MNTNTKPEFFIRGIHWRDAVNYYINNDKTQLPVLYYFGLARGYIRSYPNTWTRLVIAMDYNHQWEILRYNANSGMHLIAYIEERMVLLIENMLNEKREMDMEIEIKVTANMSQDEIELWKGLSTRLESQKDKIKSFSGCMSQMLENIRQEVKGYFTEVSNSNFVYAGIDTDGSFNLKVREVELESLGTVKVPVILEFHTNIFRQFVKRNVSVIYNSNLTPKAQLLWGELERRIEALVVNQVKHDTNNIFFYKVESEVIKYFSEVYKSNFKYDKDQVRRSFDLAYDNTTFIVTFHINIFEEKE